MRDDGIGPALDAMLAAGLDDLNALLPDEPEPCPMGCGRTTEDVYGGPCKTCWSEAPRD